MVEWVIYYGSKKMRLWKAYSGHVLIESGIGSQKQRYDLLRQAYDYKENNPSNGNNNDGCWRADIKFERSEWLHQALIKQLEETVGYYLEEDRAFNHMFNGGDPYIESWTNINDPGSLNLLHTHKSFNFSAIYYVQANHTGDLVFLNPANMDLSASYLGPGTSRMHYKPNDGDLVMWPSWIPHEVERNESDTQRVCIAFNIRFQ